MVNNKVTLGQCHTPGVFSINPLSYGWRKKEGENSYDVKVNRV